MNKKSMQKPRVPLWYILVFFCAALICFLGVMATKKTIPNDYYDIQVAASLRMQTALEVMKARVIEDNVPTEPKDINNTGMLGLDDFSPLSSTPGNEDAKRTVLNPNFAALLVRYFVEAGLEPGDTIAVGASGSFPGLMFATLCAAEEMGLHTLLIASYGASDFGATRLEFTIVDMYETMYEAGLLPHSKLLAVSPGGKHDLGRNNNIFFEDSLPYVDELVARIKIPDVEYIIPETIVESIERRLELYDAHAGEGGVACFVNIGAASPNKGTTAYTLEFPTGLVLDPPRIPMTSNRGLCFEFAARGLPIINMLNVRLLADENGLPYDPAPLPSVPDGDVYNQVTYSKALIILSIFILAGLLAWIIVKTVKSRKTDATE